jgi:regulator of replication initiation timing
LIGRQDAMAAAETEQPIGSRYNSEFGSWLAHHHFDNIDKGDRIRLIEVIDNLPAIEAWRATLTQTARLRLNHPSSILRKWKAAATEVKEPQPTLRNIVADLSEDNAKLKREVEELRARLDEAEATATRGRDGRAKSWRRQ